VSFLVLFSSWDEAPKQDNSSQSLDLFFLILFLCYHSSLILFLLLEVSSLIAGPSNGLAHIESSALILVDIQHSRSHGTDFVMAHPSSQLHCSRA
jgi:hypothetical protein